MSEKNISQLRRKLLRWYDAQRRDLPWRRTHDPYAIWISETMLQQTQVATVIPYYERFLKTFPRIEALAHAPLQKVLTIWSGLGYYRRAENLKKAAIIMTREHGANIPPDYQTLRALPGIGDYTAGALMSIAFDQPYPAIDGNARRVLSRVYGPRNEKELRALAAQLVPDTRAGDFNQSLIELGATICSAAAPHCPACPISSFCGWQSSGAQLAQKKTPRSKKVTWPLVIVSCAGRILLRRREKTGLLDGLWELPGGELEETESVRAALSRHLRATGYATAHRQQIGELRHAITNRNIRAPIFLSQLTAQREIATRNRAKTRNPEPGTRNAAACRRWRWLTPTALRRYPVSAMTSKALKLFAAYEKSFLQ